MNKVAVVLLAVVGLGLGAAMAAKPAKPSGQKHKAPADVIHTLTAEGDVNNAVTVPSWVGKRPPVEDKWVQTLDENFDGTGISTSLWTARHPYDVINHNFLNRFAEENVSVNNGTMTIKIEKRTGFQYNDPKLGERDYTTGVLTSYGKWTQLYGYFEARCKVPTSPGGIWSAFWTMPDRGKGEDQKLRQETYNGGMECDILEKLTDWGPGRYNIALHWDGYKDDHKRADSSHNYYGKTNDGWHAWGVLWEPGKYTFYCDGKQIADWTNARVCSVPSYILFTCEIRGQETRNLPSAKLPDYFQVDYVRAWQLQSRMKYEQR